MTRWPFPGDLPVDRARQVAIQYRQMLLQVAPTACEAVDFAATAAGEGWVTDPWAIEQEYDLVTVPRAAELVGRSPRWVYRWAQDNPEVIRQLGPLRVQVRDVRAAVAHERIRRSRAM